MWKLFVYKARRKLHFQLLEIMIAMFLIVVCAVPMIHTFVQIHIEQKASHRVIERNHLVHDIHAKLLEDLYQHRFSWSEIEYKQERELSDSDLVERAKKADYRVLYQFGVDQPKTVPESMKKALIKLEIKMVDLKNQKAETPSYDYYIYVQLKK